jgi:hypothetical protein
LEEKKEIKTRHAERNEEEDEKKGNKIEAK